jgi:hypothetical protein
MECVELALQSRRRRGNRNRSKDDDGGMTKREKETDRIRRKAAG